MTGQVYLDDFVASLQGWLDRFIRRLRLGETSQPERRRLLVVQIDGLSGAVLTRSLRRECMPFLARLLRDGGYRREDMSVGLPTSTPAFQMGAMYGVRPDIPGFHYHDKRRRKDIHFPRMGDAAHVEETQAAGRLGILRGGSSYGCVFTGGAEKSLFTFATLCRPTGKGILRACSGFIVLGWVFVKSVSLSIAEITRMAMRRLATPATQRTESWQWLALKIGTSVWLRQLYTLAVSGDMYAGAPAVYVNYIDYDVFAHAFGPTDGRALRALRHIDASLRQLWRVRQRVPEHRYDLYILSDHGQAPCVPYQRMSGGKPLERALIDEFFDLPSATDAVSARRPPRPGLGSWLHAYRRQGGRGLIQRSLNYLDQDFPAVLRGEKEAAERGSVRVVSAGPNAFVYFIDSEAPLTVDEIDDRHPGVLEAISQNPGIGFVLARSREGPVCGWRGKRLLLSERDPGPFAGRADLDVVLRGVSDLMEMPSAGDLVIYGNESPEGNVSFISEVGAHAGPSLEEMHTFIIHRSGIRLPSPIGHPTELYPHFLAYQEGEPAAAEEGR